MPNARRQRGAAAARPRAARAVAVGPGSLRRETSVADLQLSVMPRRRRDEFAAQVAPGTVPPCRAGRIGASAIEPARAPKCAPRDNRCPKQARRGDWKITRPKNMACLERSWGALGHTPDMKQRSAGASRAPECLQASLRAPPRPRPPSDENRHRALSLARASCGAGAPSLDLETALS